ncbi:MAG TPA: hypothetical protein DEB23_02470 [Chitinophagaceae bacterium]|nr:hypothetical protein [Chitinophagaceae bacterium]
MTDTISEETFKGNYDIVILNRMLANITPKQMVEWRKKYRFKLIVDNDDYWHLDASHILFQQYIINLVPQQIINWIQVADLCTCTHERLAEEIYKLNTNVEIIPNAIPYGEEQFILDKKPSDLVRLFWSGSGTHGKDIEILRNPMKRINFPVRTIIAGYNEGEKPIWDGMIASFTNGLKLNPTIYNFNHVTEYMAAYCDSDISLIPLVDNKFNSMKSNLKVLETASKKNPAIVSNVHPYKGFYPACHVNSQKDWYYWIKMLVNDKDARTHYGNALYEYCNKNFNLHEVNKQRFAIYSKLIDNAGN